MNVRDKLLEMGIYVPEMAHRYRFGKGCLVWHAVEQEEGDSALFNMPITRDQYEAMMAAGLLCTQGRAVETPFTVPRASVI